MGEPRINYQKILEQTIERERAAGNVPSLLLHSCCAPCSSYCIEYLSQYFTITVFYYNPNIYPDDEYYKRVEEQKRFIAEFPAKYHVDVIEGDYDKDSFYDIARGYEDCPEGGERCFRCYELRLRASAVKAAELSKDYFTTTLTISPMKNAAKLNETGMRLGEEYGVRYLCSDFKKKDGYKRSIELSGEYGLYRQDYCGCVYSRRERKMQQEM
jgi:hypothetical protein